MAEPSTDGNDALEALASRTDTEIVFESILQRCAAPVPEIVFLHMIYHELHLNKSIVDQEVDTLRHARTFKVIHIPWQTGILIALTPTAQYIADLEAAFQSPADQDMLQKYSHWIAEGANISVSAASLTQEAHLTAAQIQHLVDTGYLRNRHNHVDNSTAYWISHPHITGMLQKCREVEKTVLQAMKRTRYKEIDHKAFQALFQSKKRKADGSTSTLPSEYHLLDLLGRQVVKKVDTATGWFLRLP